MIVARHQVFLRADTADDDPEPQVVSPCSTSAVTVELKSGSDCPPSYPSRRRPIPTKDDQRTVSSCHHIGGILMTVQHTRHNNSERRYGSRVIRKY